MLSFDLGGSAHFSPFMTFIDQCKASLWVRWSITALFITIFISLMWSKLQNSRYKLPPGPKGIPFLGCLPKMGPRVHRSFAEMAKIHGPIISVRLGSKLNIVVSTAKLAEEVLKAQDHVLASRPLPVLAEHMFSVERQSLVWATLGPTWRNARKLCTVELLSPHRLKSYYRIRKEETCRMICALEASQNDGQKQVLIRNYLFAATINNMTGMVFGKRYNLDSSTGCLAPQGHEFKDLISETLRLGSVFNISDFIPSLRWLDFQGYEKTLRGFRRRMDVLTNEIMSEHMNGEPLKVEEDFLDIVLRLKDNYQLNDKIIGNLIWDMVGAGSETTVSAVEWTMAELLLHPEKMKKAQEEIDAVAGLTERAVEEDDLEKLQYVQWAFKESLRLHPPSAMLFPHLSITNCKIAGYDIPPNTAVHINAWAIARDPTCWPEADRFMPERYEIEDVDVRGTDFRLLPFGSGRRGCPGSRLAMINGLLLLTNLLHKFTWALPAGVTHSGVDMQEASGVVQCMNSALVAEISKRIP
ncbi:hypothetical protein O6H91_01G116200 [Diphasiastrum complanatum]|uniref:Uncharacterized protein n=2 Tax=Diphasiastrum complanatum TaxID=34168 RepID=A0ACC2EP80_DIPCM|nr:hypothetical protein O6H91_01G024700 [Diphasiastrum complanatum]KAJ7570343.1 hypothetical protein O6H91_01G116200 [Diphasiastrum complanatum]